MAENNTVITDVILDKKLDRYGCNDNDFVADKELTVTITLNEYRDLVGKNAVSSARISEAEKDKYDRNNENNTLKEKVKELERKLLEYRAEYGELKSENEESEE